MNEAQLAKYRARALLKRQTVIGWLGGKCERCGESDYFVLHICHKIPVRRNRPSLEAGNTLVRKIWAMGADAARERFKVLCANDHMRETWETGGWRRHKV